MLFSIRSSPRRLVTLFTHGMALGALALVCGCDTKGFLDPTEMMRTSKDTLLLPIVSQVDPALEEMDTQWSRATDPTPEDRKPVTGDYHISPDDLLAVQISDINGPGTQELKQVRVTESGNISLPLLDRQIHAVGLTEYELENAIVEAYRAANLVLHATVSVTTLESRGRQFSIYGAVGATGEYAIQEPDFRVLNALVIARNVTTPFVDYIYIIRKVGALSAQTQPGMPSEAPIAPPPTSIPTTNPTSEELVPHVEANTPAVILPAGANPVAPAAQKVVLADQAAADPSETFDGFHDPGPDQNLRVIRIPYQALKEGRLGYNIPIHPLDMIYVAEPPQGFYYIGGHVLRGGTFAMTGAKVTLKAAIISASMLDGLAIPQRTDIIRRIRPDKEIFVRVDLEKVFAGEQPDIYLKPDDAVLVGSNAAAPFLAAIRGGFRISYGFGFIYDRNYAYSTSLQGIGG